jgi:Virulence protein
MAILFGVDVKTINYHLGQIYESGELQENATIRKIKIVQQEGEREVERSPMFYNLDAIIAVGYRVNSYQATQFRIWATEVLKEFIIKGFAMDDERLKQGRHFGKDYFDDLLQRIREIRTSERRYYQKITDVYAECSADYDAKSETSKLFFKMVQNMMHWAVTHHTAAEILKDLVIIKYGKDHKNLNDGKIPVYGSGGIMRSVDEFLYSGESVLIPRKGTLNNVFYVNESFWSVDTMFYTQMKQMNIAKYVYFFVLSQNLASMNAGSAVPSMTTGILNGLKCVIAPLDIMNKFDIMQVPVFEIIQKKREEIQKLSQIRDSLLPKLMSGELKVSDLNI